MNRVKTFDSTGIATGGRLYASDLNAIQDAAAGLTDLTQIHSVGSLIVGEAGLTLSRFGTGEAQIAGAFRSTGILRGAGGVYIGQFTTTSRNAIAAGFAPNGLIIFNTTTNQFEWNSGTDGARVWRAVGFDPSGDISLGGTASSIDFTDEAASNYFLTVKRTADSVTRFVIREDGQIEWGAGGVAARDASLFRSGAGILSLGAANKLVLGSAGLQFSTGEVITGTDSITAALIAPNAIGASELADNAVDTAAIVAAAVDATKIANSLKPSAGAAAGTEALRALGLTASTAMPGNQVMSQAQLATDSVGAAQIIADAVGSAEIAAGAVDVAELAPGWLKSPITIVTGQQLFVFGSPSSFTITAPATGTYCLEWGTLHYDTENTNATSSLNTPYGGISPDSNSPGSGLAGPISLTAGQTVTITAAHASGASAGRFDSCWAKLTRMS